MNSEPNPGIEALVDAKIATGTLDSQGHFTLDLDNARRLLRQYQLPDARAYILKLVQWAVSSAPSRVDIEVSKRRVVIGHDGFGTSPGDFVEALTDPLGNISRSLAHLSIGLNSALNLQSERIYFDSLGPRTNIVGALREDIPVAETGWSRLVIEGNRGQMFLGSCLVRAYTKQFQRWTDFEGPIQTQIIPPFRSSASANWSACPGQATTTRGSARAVA